MTQIARCDWLPEQARWSHLARLGLPAVSRKKNFPESHIINPLLTKFVWSRWLDIGLGLFCEFMDLDYVSVHSHAKKELDQYPAILTSHLVNKGFILWLSGKFFLRDTAGSPERARWLHLPARVANHIARFGSSCPLAELAI